MRITTLLGSPRRNGNTAKVLGHFEKLVGDSHEVDRIDIISHRVNGCLGCNACAKELEKPGCVQKDEAVSIFERMIRSDLTVFASPLYCWDFSAQMKALIDRHYCLVKGYGTPEYRSLVEGKRAALLVTCDGSIENNADLIQGVFDRVCGYVRYDVVGKYVVPGCYDPQTVTTVGREVAKRMARDAVGATL